LNRLLSLKNFVAVVATMTVLVLAAAIPSVAFAAAGGHGEVAGHGGIGGHPGSQGHAGFSGRPTFSGHPGIRPGFVGHPGHPGFVRGHRGFVGVAPGFGWWPAYSYYEAAPYEAAPYGGYWYYCPSAGTYFPYVETCPEAWVPVPAG
jgi:hypothetical protein